MLGDFVFGVVPLRDHSDKTQSELHRHSFIHWPARKAQKDREEARSSGGECQTKMVPPIQIHILFGVVPFLVCQQCSDLNLALISLIFPQFWERILDQSIKPCPF